MNNFNVWNVGKYFLKEKALRHTNKKKCTDIKPDCDQCSYKHNTKNSLKEHKMVHGNIRHICDQCDYRATRIGNLNVHKWLVHRRTKYCCDNCIKPCGKRH